MPENLVDVLIYLYENYLDGKPYPPKDQVALEEELSQAGFSSTEIDKALRWLDELAAGAAQELYRPYARQAMRIYNAAETARLDLEVRSFLLSLEQNGILEPESRELVIDRVLAIDHPLISVEEIKWVVLLVLMSRPGCEVAFSRMEEMIYSTEPTFH